MLASSYSYDAENRLISATGANGESYVYDAIGRRVKLINNGGVRLYFYDLGGRVVTMLSSAGSWYRGEIYLGGMHLGTYASGKTYFVHSNLVGSERIRTDEQGAVNNNCTYWPFGDWQSCTNGTPVTPIAYAGYERDPETGLDHMWFRYYNPRLGRFMSADPLGGNIFNPQSLNRFAYVLNNPANLIDPLGLTAGNDCGGPCTPFTYMDANGCIWRVTYHQEKGSDGKMYDMPDFERMLCPSLGASGGGFTMGIRAPGQTFKRCMASNANTYSIGGTAQLAINVSTGSDITIFDHPIVSGVTGNMVNTFAFGSTAEAATTAAANAPDRIAAGIGSATTYGRRTTDIMSINIAGKGGVPQAMSQASAGAKGLFKATGKALSLGLTFAERLVVDSTFMRQRR